MKKYWVLAWDDYYPSSELKNVHSTHSTRREAQAIMDELLKDKVSDNVIMMDISDMIEGRDYSRDEHYEMLLSLLGRMPDAYKTALMKAQEVELVRLLNERA
jgi:hypothetical protein